MNTNQDSYEEYKRELEEELGISAVKPPIRPMNAYMRYFLERSSEERAKGDVDIRNLSKEVAQEWKNLSTNKKDFYQQIYEIRLRERDALFVQFELLSNKRKILTPYSRFIKKRYLQYSKEYKSLSSLQITKLVNEDWKALPLKEKDRLRVEFENEKNDLLLNIDRTDQINEYLERLNRYQQILHEDKEKILKKYGLSSENRALRREEDKAKKSEMKKLLRYERLSFQREEKRKYRESVQQKVRQEKERLRLIKEEQRQKEKEALKAERERIRAEEAERKQLERETEKQLKEMLKEIEKNQKKAQKEVSAKKAKEESTDKIKKEVDDNAVKSKTSEKKTEAKTANKSKKIKKVEKKIIKKKTKELAKPAKSAQPVKPIKAVKKEVKETKQAKNAPKQKKPVAKKPVQPKKIKRTIKRAK